MRKTLKQLLSLLLVLTMVASFTVTGWAVESTDKGAVPGGTELELEDLDPTTLHVPKLGEIAETGEEIEKSPFALSDIVRVSIFLNEPAVLDAGYAMEGVGTDRAAVSYRESLRRQQAQVTASIEKATGTELDVKWNMTLAVNAISANVRYGDIGKIGAVPGVKKVVLENRYEAPDDEVAQPNTANTSENMVGAVEAWDSGYTGFKSRIAIIDTGIDTSHQSFDASAFTASINERGETVPQLTIPSGLNGSGISFSSKIPYGYNYVDGDTDITHINDTQGNHGSHVAGIAAANRLVKSGSSYVSAAETVGAVGMAPDAQLLIMKVFGKSGGAYDSDYMVAIEDAIALDCDVVNLSLGSAVQGFTFSEEYQDIMNNLVNKAHNEGMVVSISAGNSYDFAHFTDSGNLYKDDVFYHTGGTPGTFVNSLCVAAAQNTIIKGAPMNFNGSRDVYYYESTGNEEEGTTYTNPALTTIVGSYQYVYIDALGTAADYSAVNSALSLSGKIVIVNRGEISFVEKGENAKSYNPKAVIIANNADGTIYMDLTYFTGTFPMVTITLKDANAIKEGGTAHTAGDITYYTGSVEVTNVEKEVIIDRSQATITDFSSWGVPGSLLMKPEITAPGGDIYSVNGTNKTSSGSTAGGSDQYVSMSGTSMAAPHIAGLTAVLAQYLRENPIADRNSELADKYSTRAIMQSLLMSTATPMQPEGEYLSILQQGAGLVEINKAIKASSVIMMGENDNTLTARTGAAADGKVKVELGDDPDRAGSYSYSFTIYNLSDKALTYELNTELFTQKISGEFLSKGTAKLPSGGVEYAWNGEAAAPIVSHDVNGDGTTNDDDLQLILEYLAGNVEDDALDLLAADVDGDGDVTSYDAYLLTNSSDEGGSSDGYVVPANGSATVTVTIELTAAQRAALAEYAKGAYLEGFTCVNCVTEGSEHAHSIPILGFFGSWTDPSMFDNMSYADGLYGAERKPYSGNADTNYLTLNVNGSNVKFSGNPYMVESEFPADRLAVSANSTLLRIAYNLIRAAGTTGVAVTKLDEMGGSVTDILSASVIGNNVYGQYHSETSGWQNTGTKIYSINKTVGSYGLQEDDVFRVGFYAVPEYNAMVLNNSYNAATSGVLNEEGFRNLLMSNKLGRGAFVGYDFTVDNTAPVIGSAALSGSQLSVTASDNQNLAYVAVLSLDGSVKYAESAPGTNSYTITFDATDAIANARGYVAVFAGDYAGNDTAAAVKVNDNAYEDKTVYVLTDTLTAGNDYVIVNRGTAGSGMALGHSGATIATNEVTVKGADGNVSAPYIDSKYVADTSVWTASNGIKLMNGNYYLRRNSNTGTTLQAGTSNNYNSWSWNGTDNYLTMTISNRSYYLGYSNGFSLNTTASSVYIYQKTVIRVAVDPYGVSDVTVTPASLELYKGNSADLTAKVLPLTTADRTVSWSSSDASVATVDANGHVEALSAGTAVITATANGDSTKSASATVTVVSVNKSLNGIVWDEEGGVYFADFNADSLPAWSKLHSDAKQLQLQNAFMANASTLYAGTLDTGNMSTVLYTVNRSSYALTEFGTNYVAAFGLARASSRYTDYMVYGYAKYLIFGNITPVEDEEGTFSGLPYGLLDLSTTDVGDAYVCGVCARSVGTTSSSFYFLDENGRIWQTTLSINTNTGSVTFSAPTLVVDTGISTSFLYQGLYYDGTYLYWGHQADNVSELIIINPSTKAVYHAGDFGEGVWPAAGFYVNGSAAPASAEDEEPAELTGLSVLATRDELMTAEIQARFTAEAERVSKAGSSAESAAFGGLNAVRARLTGAGDAAPNGATDPETDESGEVTFELNEAEVAVHNGLIAIAFDPDLLTFRSIDTSNLAHSAYRLDDKGVITLAYAMADEDAVAAGEAIAALTFTVGCEDAEVEITTLERNDALNQNEQAYAAVEGTGHAWGEPEWSWSEDLTSATATFTCANDASHVETVEAAVTSEITTEPTCEEAGVTTYTATVTDPDGREYTAVETAAVPAATGHAWGEPEWNWSEDLTSATATFTCANDASHVETVEAAVTSEITTEPTCEEAGVTTYTATVTGPDGREYTAVETVAVPAATGHAWGEPGWSWSEDLTSATATFTCANDASHVEIVDAEVTSEITTEPTCEEAGVTTYTATVTGPDGVVYTAVETAAVPAATGHAWGEPEWSWSEDLTSATATFTCANDASHVETVEAAVSSEVTEPAGGEDGRIVYTATVTGPDGVVYTDSREETLPFPQITKQPADQSGILGTFATFTVEAEGEGLTYMWQSNVGDKWSNTSFAGSKTAALTVKITQARDGRQYRCVVTDAYGNSVISEAATLTALPSIAIVKQPADVSGVLNSFVTFTVEAEGEGLTYMWQSNVGDKWSNTSFAGSKTAALTVKATAARDGKQYRCVITDANGNTVTSEAATLTVLPAIVIVKQPADVSGALDSFVTFTVEATGEGLTYMWQSNVAGKWSNTSFASSQTDTLTVKATEARDGKQYRCVITDANGNTVTSEAATLTITVGAIVIVKQPTDVSGALDSFVTFTVEATGEGLTYMWQSNVAGRWSNTNFAGSKTPAVTVKVTEARNGKQYRCVVTDANGDSVISDAATLTVAG